MRSNAPEHTPPVATIRHLLEKEATNLVDGSLTICMRECDELMSEVEKTAKEVGGKATKSQRYLVAREIKSKIQQLRSLVEGTYTFRLSSDEG